jgi:hypothetical protein
MRKFILLSSFIFLAVAGYSQFVVFGAKAGLNLSTVTGTAIVDPKLYTSFHIGGFANFQINENFMVQPEVLYSGKGAKSADQGTFKYGYINVPVLLQYKTASGFFLEAGPQIGLLISAKRKYTNGTTDIKESTKSTDYSFVGGIGYKSAIGIGVGARYDFGFFNISDAGIIRNKTIMLSIFYTFGSNEEQ